MDNEKLIIYYLNLNYYLTSGFIIRDMEDKIITWPQDIIRELSVIFSLNHQEAIYYYNAWMISMNLKVKKHPNGLSSIQ